MAERIPAPIFLAIRTVSSPPPLPAPSKALDNPQSNPRLFDVAETTLPPAIAPLDMENPSSCIPPLSADISHLLSKILLLII